jgi:dUTP pyrophosphatase
MKVSYVKTRHQATTPTYATPGSAGADIYACLPTVGEIMSPGKTALIPTGIAVELPPGWEIQVRSRSGQALRGLIVLNSPGTIDSDYRGEIMVMLYNISNTTYRVHDKEKIAQLVLSKVEQVSWQREEKLSDTKRGKKGFGSSGK